MPVSTRCHVYSIITILLWSYAYVGTRFVMTESTMDTPELAFIRNGVSALIFIAVLWMKKIPRPDRKSVV